MNLERQGREERTKSSQGPIEKQTKRDRQTGREGERGTEREREREERVQGAILQRSI